MTPRRSALTADLRLAADMAARDLESRYKRSIGGWIWLFLTPLGLLAIYWTVFGVFLEIRWEDPATKKDLGYVLPFFAGLSIYLFFSDILTSSSSLFVSKSVFVKKSAFPLWVLWLGNFLRAVTQWTVYGVILLVMAGFSGTLSLSGLVWTPLVVCNILIFCGGISLLVACLGPFLGDIGEATRLALRVLLYAAPITYPLTTVPTGFQYILWLNPLTQMVESIRSVLVFGRPADFMKMGQFAAIGVGLWGLSFWVFYRTEGAIPDVV